MTTRTVTLVLAGVLFAAGCNEQVFDPMADHEQPRERAYRPSNFFETGLVMQAPPAGTVPRERRTMNPTLTTGISGYTGQWGQNG